MKKLLYVAPHLSTGGLPQYLLKKIRLLQDTYEIYLIEFSNVSDAFVVQKNALRALLGKKMYTLGENKKELLTIIDNIRPDILHLEEIPEYFMDYDLAHEIYLRDRNYVIIETTHSSDYDTTKKVFIPDKFMGVCQCTTMQYVNHDIPMEVVEFSIDKNAVDKKVARMRVGFEEGFKHIVTVGLFTQRKNQGYVFEIARKLEGKKIKFHFVGNQADNFKFYWEPILKNKPANCIIHGEKTNVLEYLEACDVSVFASKGTVGDMELNPLVIKETLEAGTKLLMYNLDVYLRKYDSNENVIYLTGDVDEDVKNLEQELQFEEVCKTQDFASYYNAEEDRLYVTYTGKETITAFTSVADLDTNLAYYTFNWVYEPNASTWITPFPHQYLGTISQNKTVNGFIIRLYDESKMNLLSEMSVRINNVVPPTNFVFASSPFEDTGHPYLDMFHRDLCKDLRFKGANVIDAGANIGVFTLLALERGAKNVLAIEPDNRALEYLHKNFDNDDRVEIRSEALSTVNRHKKLYISPHSVGSTLIPGNSTESIDVCTLRLANFRNSFDGPIGVLKLDIEGEEFDVIDSMKDDEFHEIDSLFVEYHASTKEKLEPVILKLQRLGYDVKFLKNDTIESTMGFFIAKKNVPLTKEFRVETSFEPKENKIFINYFGPKQDLCLSIRDLSSDVPIYYTTLNFPGDSYGWWIIPVNYIPFVSFMDKPHFSGFRLDFFDDGKEQLVKTVEMKLKESTLQVPKLKISPFDCAYINYEEFFASKIYDNFLESLNNIEVAVDIGANIGVFTNYLLYKGAKKIYCAEPEPTAIKSLEYAVGENKDIVIIPYAIANETGVRQFHTSIGNTTVSSLFEDAKNVNPTNSWVVESVNVITYQKMIKDYNIDKIDLLKIDVEGAEYEIFDTLEKNDFDKIENMIIEFHLNRDGRLKEHILSKLDKYGYEYEIQYQSKIDKMSVDTAIEISQGSLLVKKKREGEKSIRRAFVTHCNSTYIPLAKYLVKSLLKFTDLPIIVYGIDCDVDIEDPRVIIRRMNTDILDPVRGGRQWNSNFNFASYVIPEDAIPGIDGKDANAYRMLSLKPTVLEDALNKGLEQGIYLDADGMARKNIVDLYQYFGKIPNYPLVGEGIHNFLILDGKWPIENDLMELLDVKQRTMYYVASNVMIFDRKCLPFIRKWKDTCMRHEILADPRRFAPFQDETVLNVLLWKHNAMKKLPLVHFNVRNLDSYIELCNTTKRNEFLGTEWQKIGDSESEIKFLHGCKSPIELQKLFDHISNVDSNPPNSYCPAEVSDTAILMLIDDTTELSKYSIDNKIRYAKAHGYHLYWASAKDEKALQESVQNYTNVWIANPNALIVNYDLKLENSSAVDIVYQLKKPIPISTIDVEWQNVPSIHTSYDVGDFAINLLVKNGKEKLRVAKILDDVDISQYTKVPKKFSAIDISENCTVKQLDMPLEDFWNGVYRTNFFGWWGDKSKSGTGSEGIGASKKVDILQECITKYGCKTMLDIGCGDFNWIKSVCSNLDLYYGVDIVKDLIKYLKLNHETERCVFEYGNISDSEYQSNLSLKLKNVDIIVLLDVLGHMTSAELNSTVQYILGPNEIKPKYLLTSNYLQSREDFHTEKVIRNQGINLSLHPFAKDKLKIIGHFEVTESNYVITLYEVL